MYIKLNQLGRKYSKGRGNVLLIHPKLQNDVHHAPSTTSQAVRPPSGASLEPHAGAEGASGCVNDD